MSVKGRKFRQARRKPTDHEHAPKAIFQAKHAVGRERLPVMLQCGSVADDAGVKMAPTFRSGTTDIDALDCADMFLADEQQTSLDELSIAFDYDGEVTPRTPRRSWGRS